MADSSVSCQYDRGRKIFNILFWYNWIFKNPFYTINCVEFVFILNTLEINYNRKRRLAIKTKNSKFGGNKRLMAQIDYSPLTCNYESAVTLPITFIFSKIVLNSTLVSRADFINICRVDRDINVEFKKVYIICL